MMHRILPTASTLLVLVAVLPLNTWAHEGHGTSPAQTIAHYVSEPMHLAPAILLVGIAIYAYKRLQGKKQDR